MTSPSGFLILPLLAALLLASCGAGPGTQEPTVVITKDRLAPVPHPGPPPGEIQPPTAPQPATEPAIDWERFRETGDPQPEDPGEPGEPEDGGGPGDSGPPEPEEPEPPSIDEVFKTEAECRAAWGGGSGDGEVGATCGCACDADGCVLQTIQERKEERYRHPGTGMWVVGGEVPCDAPQRPNRRYSQCYKVCTVAGPSEARAVDSVFE